MRFFFAAFGLTLVFEARAADKFAQERSLGDVFGVDGDESVEQFSQSEGDGLRGVIFVDLEQISLGINFEHGKLVDK